MAFSARDSENGRRAARPAGKTDGRTDLNENFDGAVADADLVLRSRSGDREAFGELWRRHYPSGIAVARGITSSLEADDLVQESFARIYRALRRGGGPNGSFRAYLFTSIRNTAAAWGRARRETAIEEIDEVVGAEERNGFSDGALDRSLTAQAFRTLPARWQEVLWYTEVEAMKPAAVAPLLGLNANAVAQLAFRAREGLRAAWVQAHLQAADDGSTCAWTIRRLGAFSRGTLGMRERVRVETHLDECRHCALVAGEAHHVASRLAFVLLPLIVGTAGASAYAASLSAAPVVAMAMPPAVTAVSGSAIASTATATGAAALPTAGLPSAALPTAALTTATASGAAGTVSGIGALIGAGSAALLVAGVIATATVLPGLVGAPVMSQPTAGGIDSSAAIETAVEADETMDTTEHPLLVVEEPPTDDGADEESDAGEPGADARAPLTPSAPVVEEPAAAAPLPEPEAPVRGPGEEGEEGNAEAPGPTVPDPDASTPTGPVQIVSTTFFREPSSIRLRIAVSGAPGATVRATIDSGRDAVDEIVLGPDGSGTLELHPTRGQIERAGEVPVELAYVIDGETRFARSESLRSLIPSAPEPAPTPTPTPAPEDGLTAPEDSDLDDAVAAPGESTPDDAASAPENDSALSPALEPTGSAATAE